MMETGFNINSILTFIQQRYNITYQYKTLEKSTGNNFQSFQMPLKISLKSSVSACTYVLIQLVC